MDFATWQGSSVQDSSRMSINAIHRLHINNVKEEEAAETGGAGAMQEVCALMTDISCLIHEGDEVKHNAMHGCFA